MCKIGFFDNDKVEDLVISSDEFNEDNDDEIFYYVKNELELRLLMIPSNCINFYVINYKEWVI